MSPVLAAFIFTFGASIGSFLNASVYRLRVGESILSGRSHCPNCGHVLGPLDLIPALSWLMLRGRCRYCRREISPQYLMVELAVGLIYVWSAMSVLGGSPFIDQMTVAKLLYFWFVGSVLTIVFLYDLKYMLILPKLVVPAGLLAAAANLALGLPWTHLLLAVGIGAGFFGLQFIISKGRWIGGGDIYLGGFMGAALGPSNLLLALFLAYVTGAIVGSTLIALRHRGWRSEIPFGTFLSLATLIALLWGSGILAWYAGLTGLAL